MRLRRACDRACDDDRRASVTSREHVSVIHGHPIALDA